MPADQPLAVFKYTVPQSAEFRIEMPVGAQILTMQRQGEEYQIWALVYVKAVPAWHYFEIAGTGQPLKERRRTYVSTAQSVDGRFVWHLFEVTP